MKAQDYVTNGYQSFLLNHTRKQAVPVQTGLHNYFSRVWKHYVKKMKNWQIDDDFGIVIEHLYFDLDWIDCDEFGLYEIITIS